MSRMQEYAKKGAIIGAIIGGVLALPAILVNPAAPIVGAISWGLLGGIVGAGVSMLKEDKQENTPCEVKKMMVRNPRGCEQELAQCQEQLQGQSSTYFQDKVTAPPAPDVVQR